MQPLVEYVTIFSGTIMTMWPIVRWLRIIALRERASEKMSVSATEAGSAINRLIGDRIDPTELAAYGGLTAAEFLWSWARLDPDVVKAAAFSSKAHISSGYDFAQFIHSHYDTLSSVAKEGFLHRLLGYVGEQQASDILLHQGHVVHAAATATQPVWDLLIDGHATNIKTVHDIASIKGQALAHHA